jgi:hypothetical protein
MSAHVSYKAKDKSILNSQLCRPRCIPQEGEDAVDFANA